MIQSETREVVFSRPFTLPGLGRSYPAGRYTVTSVLEQLDLSFAATRRVGMTILLKSGGVTEAWAVTPADLDAALASDKA